jgi:HAD superfamily hydrolase (TIGR01484 family)
MNSMEHPAAAIFDLDGTLASSKSPVTSVMGEHLAQLLERMPVAIMSGGAYHQFEAQLLPGLPHGARLERLYLFPTSAAQAFQYRDGAWVPLYDHAFTPLEREEVLAALSEALKETGLDTPPAQVWGERIEDRGAQITFSGLGQKAPIQEKEAWDPDLSIRRPLAEALQRRLPSLSIRMNATTSIDITREGMTKAYGVHQFSKIIGIPINGMLYVGDALFDGGNDAIVKETGISTRAVTGPQETLEVIEELIA